MTRTISLIIGIAVVALVAVPAAFGEGRLAGSPEQTGNGSAASHYTPQVVQRMSDSWAARGGVLTNVPASSYYLPQQIEAMSKSWAARMRADQKLAVSRPDSHEFTRPLSYLDGPERSALFSEQSRSETVLLSGDDHVTTPVADEPAPTTSGRDIEWPQIGIGFGIGILLAIGLGLSFKATRPRTLAH
jgi:hypothetical protein